MRSTIFALATGSLPCAVAIVRISGPSTRSVSERVLGFTPAERVATYAGIRDPETSEVIDNGLVLFFCGPRSFTGEDSLELQIHGSRAVLARLLRVLSNEADMRPAEPGEFIRRAFENGKSSLLAVEGVADLIDARTEAQRRQALALAGGHLANEALGWRAQILDILSLIAAEIDFTDEGDAPSNVIDDVRTKLQSLLSALQRALLDADRGQLIRSGTRIVIGGPPNAGKSSLLNALVRRDAAIVTEVAGTTRDVLEIEFDLNGHFIVLCDTAGIRETDDSVERIGIARARDAARNAALLLWLTEGSDIHGPAQPDTCDAPVLRIATKMDLIDSLPVWADLGVSSLTGAGIPEMLDRLAAFAADMVRGDTPLVTNERQRACISAASVHLSQAATLDALELVADEVQKAASCLDGLLGRLHVEDVLGSVFSRFCMGK